MGEGKTSFSCSSSKPRGRIEDEDENEKEDEAAVHGKPPFVFRMHWDHEPLRLTEARSGPRVCDPQLARFMERTPRTLRAPCSVEPASGPLTQSLSPLRGGRGCPKGG